MFTVKSPDTMNDFNQNELKVTAVIAGTIIFFFIYYYLAYSNFLSDKISVKKFGEKKEITVFFVRKILGFLLLGIVPAIIYYTLIGQTTETFGLTLQDFISNLKTILILVLLIIAVVYLQQKINPGFMTLQMDLNGWNSHRFVLDGIGWIIYLTAYEFLFRGILLFESYRSFGFWPAIAVNTAIYSAIHMVDGKEKAVGALVFGTVACYFTLHFETILYSDFYAHCA